MEGHKENKHRRLLDWQRVNGEAPTDKAVLARARIKKWMADLNAEAFEDPRERALTEEDVKSIALGIYAGLADGAIGATLNLSPERVLWMRRKFREALGIKSKAACGKMAVGMGGGGVRR